MPAILAPSACELCHGPIAGEFVEGRLLENNGTWAIMCPACHAEYGCGVGLGFGQRFIRAPDGAFYKEASK